MCAPITVALANDRIPTLVKKPRPASSLMKQLELDPELALKVGRQVWYNETGGDRDTITAWNASENFASLGIGHFIWFAQGRPARFQESFPDMISFMRSRGAKPPSWLDTSPIPPCPWTNRAEFKRNFHSEPMVSLRKFLLDTVGLQAQYLALRMQGALPKMLASLNTSKDKAHVRDQFMRVVTASSDLYPLVDYVNFKGEGISPTEAYPNANTGKMQGWGLKHVLLEMRGTSTDTSSVLNEFADAAATVLKRRVQNNPPNKRWLKGWLTRVKTYNKPLR